MCVDGETTIAKIMRSLAYEVDKLGTTACEIQTKLLQNKVEKQKKAQKILNHTETIVETVLKKAMKARKRLMQIKQNL